MDKKDRFQRCRRLVGSLLAGGCLAIASYGPVQAHEHGDQMNAQVDDLDWSTRLQLLRVQLATYRYHDPDQAIADGFRPLGSGACYQSPEGGMGIHYGKTGRIANPEIRLLRPEILLYEPGPDGLRLIGVEYLKSDIDQDLATDDDRPSLFGVPFDGPMLGHEPGQPIHYDLHVWLWRQNPSGMFSKWNPNVSCA